MQEMRCCLPSCLFATPGSTSLLCSSINTRRGIRESKRAWYCSGGHQQQPAAQYVTHQAAPGLQPASLQPGPMPLQQMTHQYPPQAHPPHSGPAAATQNGAVPQGQAALFDPSNGGGPGPGPGLGVSLGAGQGAVLGQQGAAFAGQAPPPGALVALSGRDGGPPTGLCTSAVALWLSGALCLCHF